MLASLESRRNKAARRDRAVLDLLVEQIEQQLLVAKRAIFSPILMACETSGCRARLFLSPPILVGGIACALDQQKQRNPRVEYQHLPSDIARFFRISITAALPFFFSQGLPFPPTKAGRGGAIIAIPLRK
jgi:hypothetical protein